MENQTPIDPQIPTSNGATMPMVTPPQTKNIIPVILLVVVGLVIGAVILSITLKPNNNDDEEKQKVTNKETEFSQKYQIELVSGNGTNVGDELKIKDEHFYVISNDGTTAVLFAKYNLEVGSDCILNGPPACTEIEKPSGIQNNNALGYDAAASYDANRYGVVPFSSTNYWFEDYSIGGYTIYVYDDNASIKTYVDKYEAYLEDLGLKVNESRLIKNEELAALGCNIDDFDCAVSSYNWVYSTSYWLGSVNIIGDSFVWAVESDGSVGYFNNPTLNTHYGVRPVIIISSSSIK